VVFDPSVAFGDHRWRCQSVKRARRNVESDTFGLTAGCRHYERADPTVAERLGVGLAYGSRRLFGSVPYGNG